MFNVKVILLKRSYKGLSFTNVPRGSECENNLSEVMAWKAFPDVEFDL